jgi:hypothetical protein
MLLPTWIKPVLVSLTPKLSRRTAEGGPGGQGRVPRQLTGDRLSREELFITPGLDSRQSDYLPSVRMSCAATTCHLPFRLSHVSVQTRLRVYSFPSLPFLMELSLP